MITTSRHEKQVIAAAARSIRAKRVVEIGVFKGQTTAVLSEVTAESGGYVVAVDPMKWASKPASIGEYIDAWLHPFSYEPAFWRNVNKAGKNNVRLIRKLSNDPTLLSDPDPELRDLDLVFIDGEHTYEAARRDVADWGSRVRRDGLILMHDVFARFPGVEKAFAELAADPRLEATWPDKGTVGILRVREPLASRDGAKLAAE
jgi:predicted O-methyltransferase YrrM